MPKEFLGEDFLLASDAGRRLYHDYAAGEPIYDYHSHLSPLELASDRRFANLTQIWLDGDHYKWRALRTAGVAEELITGHADDRARFAAWAATVPQCVGNPLYHWTHLELQRYFGVRDLLSPTTAESIWQRCNAALAGDGYGARGLLRRMNVRMVGTTDDPIDDLAAHAELAADRSFDIAVLPTWRPDRALKIELDGFASYVEELGAVAGLEIRGFDDLCAALARRLEHFAAHGCVSADHGADVLRFGKVADDGALNRVLMKRLEGRALDEAEITQHATALQLWLGREYARRGWVMQLHMGAQRNNRTRGLEQIGPNSGFDSIGDRVYAAPLAALLDALDRDDALPRTILYCLNPRDNEMLATMAGNFQGGGVAGKMQFGSAWWFNDQQDGILRQLTCVAQMGLLSRFVGMLTDSRSLLSFPRHEYFRRILCDLVGGWVERGEAPRDFDLLGGLVKDVCSRNAVTYFGLDRAAATAGAPDTSSASGNGRAHRPR